MSIPSFPYSRQCPYSIPSEYNEFRQLDQIPEAPLPHGGTVHVLTRYKDVKTALSSEEFSNKRTHPNYPSPIPIPDAFRTNGSMLGLDPPEHAKVRGMIRGEFTARRVAERTGTVREAVAFHIDRLLATPSRSADLVQDFSIPLTLNIIGDLLAIPACDLPKLRKATRTMFDAESLPEDRSDAINFLDDYFEDFVQRRIKVPHDDLMGRVITANSDYPSTELVHMTRLILNGGHDSTASMLTLGTLILLNEPDLYRQLSVDPALTASTVEELLRFLCVTDLTTPRVALREVSLRNHSIPRDSGVHPSTAAANRDPEVFPNPDVFDPRRTNVSRHLTFGYGRHLCLGSEIARMEMREVFSSLSRRIPQLQLAVPRERLRYLDGGLVFKVAELPVKW